MNNAELLGLMRGRFLPQAQRHYATLASHLLALAGHPTDPGSEGSTEALRKWVVSELRHANEDATTVEVVGLMVGADPSTAPVRVKRTDIVQAMAKVLPRLRTPQITRVTHSDYELSARRIYELERDYLVKVLAAAINRRDLMPAASRALNACRIRFAVRPSEDHGGETAVLGISYDFCASLKEILVASTSSGTYSDSLCARWPEILDVFVPSTSTPAQIRGSFASLHNESLVTELNFEYVPSNEWPASVSQSQPPEDLEVWRARLGAEADWRIWLFAEVELALDEWVYWTAPCRVWLDALEFDLSAFPDIEKYDIRTKLRLGREARRANPADRLRLAYFPECWLSAGTGIEVTWIRRQSKPTRPSEGS